MPRKLDKPETGYEEGREAMTQRPEQRLIIAGFTVVYIALMLILVSATSPHFDGSRNTFMLILAVLSGLGAIMLAVGRLSQPA